jgi:hypothetical protein
MVPFVSMGAGPIGIQLDVFNMEFALLLERLAQTQAP